MTPQTRTAHWAVTVWRNGDSILTMESNCLSGRDLSPDDEETIRDCGRHLLAFVGAAPRVPAAPPPTCSTKVYRCNHCGHETNVTTESHITMWCDRTNCRGTRWPVPAAPPQEGGE